MAFLKCREAKEKAVDRWHKAAEAVHVTDPAARKCTPDTWPASMSNFYWDSIAHTLYQQLLQVRQGLERKWVARDPSTRWTFVESVVKSLMLHKKSHAKTLYQYVPKQFVTKALCIRLPGSGLFKLECRALLFHDTLQRSACVAKQAHEKHVQSYLRVCGARMRVSSCSSAAPSQSFAAHASHGLSAGGPCARPIQRTMSLASAYCYV
jgi:hypothetical protein